MVEAARAKMTAAKTHLAQQHKTDEQYLDMKHKLHQQKHDATKAASQALASAYKEAVLQERAQLEQAMSAYKDAISTHAQSIHQTSKETEAVREAQKLKSGSDLEAAIAGITEQTEAHQHRA